MRAIFGHVINETNNERNISTFNLPRVTFSEIANQGFLSIVKKKKKGGKQHYFPQVRYTSPVRRTRYVIGTKTKRGLSAVPIPRSRSEKLNGGKDFVYNSGKHILSKSLDRAEQGGNCRGMKARLTRNMTVKKMFNMAVLV